jgi:hypothetical protein
MIRSCFDYHEADRCYPDEFARLNCSTDRIQCVYVSYGFHDKTFERYVDTVWSRRLAKFLNENSNLFNLFNIFMIYWLIAFSQALERMILACTFFGRRCKRSMKILSRTTNEKHTFAIDK